MPEHLARGDVDERRADEASALDRGEAASETGDVAGCERGDAGGDGAVHAQEDGDGADVGGDFRGEMDGGGGSAEGGDVVVAEEGWLAPVAKDGGYGGVVVGDAFLAVVLDVGEAVVRGVMV